MEEVSRFESRLFCDVSLDNEIWNYIEHNDGITYITSFSLPKDYVVEKTLSSNGACVAHKDDKRYLIVESSVFELQEREYELIDIIFDATDARVFKYDGYPTYVFEANGKYYLKYDVLERICELYKSKSREVFNW